MEKYLKFYIDGKWVDPAVPKELDVINPATEEPFARISLGSAADVDKAVAAARAAFETYSLTSREERIALLEKILEIYMSRIDDVASAISKEMGAPMSLAKRAQAPSGVGHLKATLAALKDYKFEEDMGRTRVVREPIGVCGFITPWNWPINQIACKVFPALAAGCTMVLKPSEVAPVNAYIFSEVMHEAGVPAGVFNMVNGDGPGVGALISAHPGIDMVSFTGSTRAGILISKAAADTIKRVTLELGGKSANIILEDSDFEKAVTSGVSSMMNNSGQSCNAPSRMLVPLGRHDEAVKLAAEAATKIIPGNPSAPETTIGPVVSAAQFAKIQGLIEKGIAEGATLAAGGPGRPNGLNKGYYVAPTVFGNVSNDMTIAREEIFGPVLSIIPYKDEEDAIRIANDTVYGLSAYVQSKDIDHARKVALRMRSGDVHINGAPLDQNAPFGGYKQSGNGREYGKAGLEEFLEMKTLLGYSPG